MNHVRLKNFSAALLLSLAAASFSSCSTREKTLSEGQIGQYHAKVVKENIPLFQDFYRFEMFDSTGRVVYLRVPVDQQLRGEIRYSNDSTYTIDDRGMQRSSPR